ncbi:MAG TPA: nodulation protein NfeD [Dehalococcoidia bacterium]|nr:nodulation protein NfeD [Dehalococcoidia bacterium]
MRGIGWLLPGLLGLLLLLATGCAGAPKTTGAVHVLRADGPVNPVLASYIDRGIDGAEKNGVAVVLELDTPGGLDSSMRKIIQRILASRVPVIVYVYPPGARAASAGTFIVMAGHVAAMAPNTAIGAAHPVGGGGEELEGAIADKVTNDAVAYIKGIARLRGRNEDWAEKAVRQSLSVHQDDAVALKVVDLVAPDLPSLLRAVDGREVQLSEGPAVLRTATAPTVRNDMSLVERFLYAISDPNIAFLLMTLGATALIFEFINPGAILPGVFGAIALLLAFFSVGSLPFNWAALLLIGLAFILFILELFVTSFGLLAIGGVISLGLGGLLLVSQTAPGIELHRWLVFSISGAIGAFFALAMTAVFRSRHRPVAVGPQTLLGRTAVARTELSPEGTVFVEGELWSAICEDGDVAPGEEVVVTAVEGLKLRVRK